LTIKGLKQWSEPDPQEQTIRPLPKKTEKAAEPKPQQGHRRQKSKANATGAPQPKSPNKAQFGTKFELPPRPDVIYREQSVEDYSDLFADNDSVFSQRLNVVVKVRLQRMSKFINWFEADEIQDAPQLFHPSDLTSLPRSTQSPVGGSMRRQITSRPSVLPEQPVRRTRSTVEITKFAEDEGDEDFSDIFGAGWRAAYASFQIVQQLLAWRRRG
jgi:hypothetical protein